MKRLLEAFRNEFGDFYRAWVFDIANDNKRLFCRIYEGWIDALEIAETSRCIKINMLLEDCLAKEISGIFELRNTIMEERKHDV